MPQTGNVLIVDDDEDTCAVYRDVLNEFGIQADVARDGTEAEELMNSNSYHLALLDFRMPGLSGVEVFTRLRTLRDGIAGIMIAAFLTDDAEASAHAAGISQIFSKPVDFAALLPLIQEIVSRM
jgi:DNA-binding response OmpR family regulator